MFPIFSRFLSVELHLLSLAKKQNKRDLLRALQSLPKDLDGIFQETMDRISTQDPEDVKLAHRILSWLSYSPQPMTVEEMQHALAIEPETESFDFDMIVDENLLVSVCSGLVTIETKSRVIRLVHFTAQEYIANVRREIFPNAKFEILVCCLTYLQQRTFKLDMCLNWGVTRALDSRAVPPYHCSCTGCRTGRSIWESYASRCVCQNCCEYDKFLFYNHANQTWSLYARGQLEQDSRTALAIIDFLSNDTVRGSFNVINKEVLSFMSETCQALAMDVTNVRNMPRLNVAVVLGLPSICDQLLEDEVTTEADLGGEWSALHCAVWKDDIRILQLLLRTRADVDRCRNVSTPLIVAMKLKRLKMLRALLEDETLGTRKNPIGQGALVAATSLGANAISVIKLLLEHGVPADSREPAHENTALHKAEHVSVAKLLLDNGANVRTVNVFGKTPLHRAAIRGYGEVARLLLEHGADANATDNRLCTPLHDAAISGFCNMVNLLIENGANLNAKFRDPPLHSFTVTPLTYSIMFCQDTVAILLIEQGAVIRAADITAMTQFRNQAWFPINSHLARLLMDSKASDGKEHQLLTDREEDQSALAIEEDHSDLIDEEDRFEVSDIDDGFLSTS